MRTRLRFLEFLKDQRLVLVSNRAAYVLRETPRGLKGERAAGGLVAALEPLMLASGGVWVAWGGRTGRSAAGVRREVPFEEPRYTLREVLLTPEEVAGYYQGYANRVLWPLCHYFLEKNAFPREAWEAYRAVNEKFASLAAEEAAPEDLVWVHDYHLALVPALIRARCPQNPIAFFWHIPFPDVGVFRVLPQAEEILAGLLGSDLVGFHVPSYCRNFLDAVEVILGARVNRERSLVEWQGRAVHVGSFPVGVDYDSFAGLAARPEVRQKARELRQVFGTPYVFLGVDRLDYTKGICQRLQALELFLERNPRYWGQFTYVQVAVPTRSEVPEYQALRREVEETVGRINGRFGRPGWQPVSYFYCSLPRPELVSYYLAADVLLVTPLRDGLNLVAKEYVASRQDENGVLILSIFAGAAEELRGALLVNPYDVEEVCEALEYSLEMPEAEKTRRFRGLRGVVASRDVTWWHETFLAAWAAASRERSLRLLRRASALGLEFEGGWSTRARELFEVASGGKGDSL